MSTTPSPRFVCRVIRLWHAVLPGPGGRGRSRHIDACADCRQFFHAGDELESALRRDAVRFAPLPSEGIERRIMQAIDRSTRTARPARPPLALIWSGAAIVAAALIASFVLYPTLLKRGGPTPDSSADVNDAVAMATSLTSVLKNSVAPSARTLVADNPLQHELDSVYSDTRSALNFLASNFLPTSPTTPTLQPAGADAIRGS